VGQDEDDSWFRRRVRVVPGDLSLPGLGLSRASRRRLAALGLGTIVHNGALVHSLLPYADRRLHATNVAATAWLLRFAKGLAVEAAVAAAGVGAREATAVNFFFVSSTSAVHPLSPAAEPRSAAAPAPGACSWVEGLQRSKQKRGSRPLDERTRTPAGMVHQMGGYGQSKWVCERLVEQAAAAAAAATGCATGAGAGPGPALRATILRLGMVGPCAATGAANATDWLCRAMEACRRLRAAPSMRPAGGGGLGSAGGSDESGGSGSVLRLVPVDHCAAYIGQAVGSAIGGGGGGGRGICGQAGVGGGTAAVAACNCLLIYGAGAGAPLGEVLRVAAQLGETEAAQARAQARAQTRALGGGAAARQAEDSDSSHAPVAVVPYHEWRRRCQARCSGSTAGTAGAASSRSQSQLPPRAQVGAEEELGTKAEAEAGAEAVWWEQLLAVCPPGGIVLAPSDWDSRSTARALATAAAATGAGASASTATPSFGTWQISEGYVERALGRLRLSGGGAQTGPQLQYGGSGMDRGMDHDA
jgi:hypothetical protein